MRRYTRGEFLSLSAMLAGAASLAKLPFRSLGAQAPAPAPLPQRGTGVEADLVVVNGRVITMDATTSRAEAFAVKDGRFLAIGSTADVRNLATARTRVIDAAGMCVLPGFIDAHCHPSGVNELYGVVVSIVITRPLTTTRSASTPVPR